MDFYSSVSFFDGVKCFGNFPTVGMQHGGCIEIGVDNFHHTIPLAGVQDFLDNCHSDYVVDYDNFLNSLPLWRKCELDVTLNEFLFKYNQRITKILNLINGDYFDSFDVKNDRICIGHLSVSNWMKCYNCACSQDIEFGGRFSIPQFWKNRLAYLSKDLCSVDFYLNFQTNYFHLEDEAVDSVYPLYIEKGEKGFSVSIAEVKSWINDCCGVRLWLR